MAARKKTAELAASADPKTPLDGGGLLAAAKPVLALLNADLLERADKFPGVTEALQARHQAEQKQHRTADDYTVWRRNFIEQVAAAWFLSVVFVRTLEDRGLLARNRIAGEGALDSQKTFFALAPSLTERDYLLAVFRELSQLPAARDLFDAKHNPVWLLGPSATATQRLLQLFRTPNDLTPAFRFGGDTRFLGDLYQDVSENVRKRYALLQTPRFVESFILDQTLEPAIARFGLDEATLVDPTCGSGHFLLGAFDRLLQHRLSAAPGVDVRQAARKALDAVAGSDINPYAVAIARFRLTLAFLERAGYTKLADAPRLSLHLAVADSLLHNHQKGLDQTTGDSAKYQQRILGETSTTNLAKWEGELFELEDPDAVDDVLGKRYTAVVGNPPYIVVQDAKLREVYRAMYSTAFRSYSLAVPFKERFFQLGRLGGYIGMITANSFMKREFGKKVIEEFLPSVNLTHVVNTSGAFIPGHGTPTVLLFGTAEAPIDTDVLTVLANRGEPKTPENAEQGLVWRSIADHSHSVGFENDYVTVKRTPRKHLRIHPWSLGGGGATDLKLLLEERSVQTLSSVVSAIGRSTHTGEDTFFFMPLAACRRHGIPTEGCVPLVKGEQVRDWMLSEDEYTLFPYDAAGEPKKPTGREEQLYWTYRTLLKDRQDFGKKIEERGLQWWEHSMFFKERFARPLSIAFAFVATHNHFVLDRGAKVFKQSAPIIKLPESATEDDHYALLAYLNSSTACFWMKQVSHNKSNAGQKHSTDPARAAYEFAGTALGELPVFRGAEEVVNMAKELDELGNKRAVWLGGTALLKQVEDVTSRADLERRIADGWLQYEGTTQRAVFLQEEIDWAFYAAAGLASAVDDNNLASSDIKAALGSRPFEVRQGYDAGVSPRARNTQGPAASECAPTWRARAALLTDPIIQQLESREYKRMWRDTEQNIDQAEFRNALPRNWLTSYLHERLEASFQTEVRSGRDLTSALSTQSQFSTVSEYLNRSPEELVKSLLKEESVPFLEAYVYTDAGKEKREAWHLTWEAQRAEDRGEPISISIPPTFSQGSRGKSKDFASDAYWRLRGKLDVPKERFISYPGCESDEDREPVYGWAGWNHRQRAVALATLYTHRKREEGWKKDRLQPMLAGLSELLPWLLQWHNEPDAEFDGAVPAVQFAEFLDAECAEHGFTYDDLRNWRPRTKTDTAKEKAAQRASAKERADSVAVGSSLIEEEAGTVATGAVSKSARKTGTHRTPSAENKSTGTAPRPKRTKKTPNEEAAS